MLESDVTETGGNTNMAHFIADTCIACGACVGECPTGAISEGDPIYVIDPETCIDCGACVPVCPTSSIAPK